MVTILPSDDDATTTSTATYVGPFTIRAWPHPRTMHRERGKVQAALFSSTSATTGSPIWKLSTDAVRELSLLQHVHYVSSTCILQSPHLPAQQHASTTSSEVTASASTLIAAPVQFVNIAAISPTAMTSNSSSSSNLYGVDTDSHSGDANDGPASIQRKSTVTTSPDFRTGWMFSGHLLCSLSQLIQPADDAGAKSYARDLPLYLRWQWTHDLLRAVTFLVDRGVVLSYLDTEHELGINDRGQLMVVGLSTASLLVDQRHPYTVAKGDAPVSSTATPGSASKRKSSSAAAGNVADEEGVDWPSHMLPFVAPELLFGSVASVQTTTYHAMALVFYILSGKHIIKPGKTVAKQVEYVYKVLGTPKAQGYREFDQLPFADRYGRQLPAGESGASSSGESRARVGKVARGILQASADTQNILTCLSASEGSSTTSTEDNGLLIDLLKRGLDLVPQRRCVHFLHDGVLSMAYLQTVTEPMTALLRRDNVQLLYRHECWDLQVTEHLRVPEVPLTRRVSAVHCYLSLENHLQEPTQPTHDLVGAAAVVVLQNEDATPPASSNSTATNKNYATAPAEPTTFASFADFARNMAPSVPSNAFAPAAPAEPTAFASFADFARNMAPTVPTTTPTSAPAAAAPVDPSPPTFASFAEFARNMSIAPLKPPPPPPSMLPPPPPPPPLPPQLPSYPPSYGSSAATASIPPPPMPMPPSLLVPPSSGGFPAMGRPTPPPMPPVLPSPPVPYQGGTPRTPVDHRPPPPPPSRPPAPVPSQHARPNEPPRDAGGRQYDNDRHRDDWNRPPRDRSRERQREPSYHHQPERDYRRPNSRDRDHDHHNDRYNDRHSDRHNDRYDRYSDHRSDRGRPPPPPPRPPAK